MIDHVMLMVKDKGASERFYDSVLGGLGISLIHSSDEYSGFGQKGSVSFWLKQAESGRQTRHVHMAFSAAARNLVDRFYETALKWGATSNGKPGLRTEHGPNYYAAYIYDLDGHNIEAVCYAKEES